MQSGKERLDWLQGLRGIAAIAVVICHARFFLQGTRYAAESDQVLKVGESGVDLFFVISGFIMAFNLSGKDGGLRTALSFAARRFARIWPAYATITILTFLYRVLSPDHSGGVSLTGLMRSVFFIPVRYPGLYLDQYMPQGWTLTFEAYFYVVLAICVISGRLIWLAFALWTTVFLIGIPTWLGAQSLLSPFLPFVDDAFRPKALTILCNPIVWEFIGGVATGLLYRSQFSFRNPVAASILLWSSVAFTVVQLFDSDHSHGIFQWGIAFVQLVFVISIASKSMTIDMGRVLSSIGAASYTLYLVHLLLFDIVNDSVRWAGFGDVIPTPGYVVAMTTGSVGVALTLSRFLEYRLSRIVFVAIENVLPYGWRSSHVPLAEVRNR